MLFEPSEHEPDEYDPEAGLEDPDVDGVTIPSVPTAEDDVPPDLAKTFWIVVVVVNAAILSLSLGALLLWFRGDATVGGALLSGGVVLLALAVRRYRRFDDSSDQSGAGEPDESADSGPDESADRTTERPGEARDDVETVSGPERVADSPEGSPPHDEDRT